MSPEAAAMGAGVRGLPEGTGHGSDVGEGALFPGTGFDGDGEL